MIECSIIGHSSLISVNHRCFPAIREWGDAGFFFEEPDKMVGVLDADHLADIYNLFIRGEQKLLGLFDADFVQVLYGRVFIILGELAAQAVLVDTVFEGELVEGVGLLIGRGKTVVHISDVGGNMVGTRLLECTYEIELCEKGDQIPRAHHAVDFRVHIVSQHLFPGFQSIGIFVKPIDQIPQLLYFHQVTVKNGSTHKANRVVPDIVLADQLVVLAAVDDREGAFDQVISRMNSFGVFAVQLSSPARRVYEADRVEVCRFIGERRRDGYAFVAQLVGESAAEIVIPAVRVFKIVGQGEAVARLGRDQTAKELGGK